MRHRYLLLPLTLTLLSACATVPQQLPPGSTLAAAEAQLGRPTQVCQQTDGTQHYVWSGQPFGQYAWGADVDASGRIPKGVEQMLSDKHFDLLDTGKWTPERVRCEFGPPVDTDTVGLAEKREVVWSYRYKQNDVWNSLMYVYLGPKGDQYTHHHPGPDPMFDPDLRFPFRRR